MASWYPHRENDSETPEDPETQGNPWVSDSGATDHAEKPLPQHWAPEDTSSGTAPTSAHDGNPYADQPLAGPWGDGSPQETIAGDYPVIARTAEERAEEQRRAQNIVNSSRKSGGCLGVFALFAGLATMGATLLAPIVTVL